MKKIIILKPKNNKNDKLKFFLYINYIIIFKFNFIVFNAFTHIFNFCTKKISISSIYAFNLINTYLILLFNFLLDGNKIILNF